MLLHSSLIIWVVLHFSDKASPRSREFLRPTPGLEEEHRRPACSHCRCGCLYHLRVQRHHPWGKGQPTLTPPLKRRVEMAVTTAACAVWPALVLLRNALNRFPVHT